MSNPRDEADARRAYQRDYYRKKIKPKREKSATTVREDRKMLVSLRIKTSLAGRIAGLFHAGVAKETISHRTPSEFYAELLLRGLETMQGDEQVDEALQYLRAVSATDSIARHRSEAQAAFSRVKIELTELLQIKAVDQATHYYWTTVRAFSEMSPNVWRDWFLLQMATTFPKLARQQPKGVSLSDGGKAFGKAKRLAESTRAEQGVQRSVGRVPRES